MSKDNRRKNNKGFSGHVVPIVLVACAAIGAVVVLTMFDNSSTVDEAVAPKPAAPKAPASPPPTPSAPTVATCVNSTGCSGWDPSGLINQLLIFLPFLIMGAVVLRFIVGRMNDY